jgi:glycosyltransferase involved in cell wall biosynthesis
MNPTLSVIIPTFNNSNYISAALESVLMQVPHDTEIIVINDGSTDNTLDVLKAYQARIQIINQTKQGIGAARNAGIIQSQGKYIGFLDSDDLWTPDHYSTLMELFHTSPDIDLAYGSVEEFTDPPNTQYVIRKDKLAILGGTTFVTRHFINTVGLFKTDLIVGEFIEWVGRARALNLKEQGASTIILQRRIHGNNTTIQYARHFQDYCKVLRNKLHTQQKSSPLNHDA